MSTADKLNKVLETKQAIKQAIIDKGGTVGDVFAEYPTAIQNIQGGGGSGKFVVPKDLRFSYSTIEEFPEDWDWSEWKQTDVKNAFSYCSNLVKLPDVDTSQAKNFAGYVTGCSKLKSATVDTRSAENISTMFYDCFNLKDLSELDLTKVTSAYTSEYSSPFYRCGSLRNFGGFKNITRGMNMAGCYSLSYESLLNIINKASNTGSATLYFTQDCVNQLSDDDIAIATNKGWTISPAKNITETILVTDLSQIKSNTYQITPKTYDFSQFTGVWGSGLASKIPYASSKYVFEANINSTTNAASMFADASSMRYIYLTGTSNITNMSYMFYLTSSLNELYIEDTSNVTTMANMFGKANVDSIDFSNWDVSNVTDFGAMFEKAKGDTVDLSTWKNSDLDIRMFNMFGGSEIKHIIMGETKNVTSMQIMFTDCSKLESVTMRSDISRVQYIDNMFKNVTTNGTFYYNPEYDYSRIIEQLPATWTAVPLTE